MLPEPEALPLPDALPEPETLPEVVEEPSRDLEVVAPEPDPLAAPEALPLSDPDIDPVAAPPRLSPEPEPVLEELHPPIARAPTRSGTKTSDLVILFTSSRVVISFSIFRTRARRVN